MRNIRLIVAYDGTKLLGYQRQAVGMTVQGELEKALSQVCDEPISIYGASRTDAGVHARFQVVTFKTTGRIPVENLPRALIAHLPPFIVITKAEEIPLDWKPRWNIVGKEYIYSIYNAPVENPLKQRFHWYMHQELDVKKMREAARLLEGTHDFSTFQGTNSTPADPVKTIYKVSVIETLIDKERYSELNEDSKEIKIHVFGDGFLYHMVRNMAGLLVEVGLGKRMADHIPDYLEARNRSVIGKTAPAHGLCLEEIFFTEERMKKVIEETCL